MAGSWLAHLQERPTWRIAALSLLGAASFIVYFFAFVVPYFLWDHILIPLEDLPKISSRQVPAAIIFILSLLFLFAVYACLIWLYRRGGTRREALLALLWSALLGALLILVHPLGASDIFDYAAHGEQLAYHWHNPLVTAVEQTPDMAFRPYSAFYFTPSNYGPLWTWIEGAVVTLAGNRDIVPSILAFKAIAVVAYLAQAGLVYFILKQQAPERAMAGLVFVAWNPLVLYESAVNGHNDALMMALALLGIWFWYQRRPLPMALALTLSFLVKIPTLLLFGPLVLSLVRWSPGWRSRFYVLTGCGAVVAAVAILLYGLLPDGFQALTNLQARGDLFTFSLPTLVRYGVWWLSDEASATTVARWATLGLFALVYAWQSIRSWRRPGEAVASSYWIFAWLLLAFSTWFQPWYVTWLVALAALFPTRQSPFQAGLFSLSVTWSYIVYGFVWFWIVDFANWWHGLGITLLAVACGLAPVWLFSLVAWLAGAGTRRAVSVDRPLASR